MTEESPAGWTVLIPVKSLDRAKTRLSTRTAADRRSLVLAFALDVVDAALATDGVERVVVAADDEDVRLRVAELGATGLESAADEGLDGVLARAASEVCPDGPVVVVVADLPALRTQDLALALGTAAPLQRCFVSDTEGTGTTLLAARAGRALDPRFGPRSRAAHAASGAVEITVPGLARLRCDVDTEIDLRYARILGLGPRSLAAVG